MSTHRPGDAGTDVRPAADGRWLATCECGARAEHDDVGDGWAWVVGHPCPLED